MIDNMYSIKEASKLLDCSTQNIYRQKAELISKGLMEQAETGSYYLNEKGINYLKEKRIETMKNSQDFNQVDNQVFKSVASPVFANDNTDLINLLKEQIQDLKNEKEYWKKEYEKKDQELTKTNEHLQNMNTTVFQKLLADTTGESKENPTENKKGFFKRFFS